VREAQVKAGSARGRLGGRPIRVLLADDHAMVREGMAEMLSLEGDIEVVAQAGDGREAVKLARETDPDVVILDVEMPVLGAQGALNRLLAVPSPPKVVIVTVFADPRLVRELLGLGASAFLAKNASSQDLLNTVRSVARGADSSGDNVTLTVPRDSFEEKEPSGGALSRREVEILRLVARGMANKEIADSLHVSESTVKRHLANAFDKLGAGTRGEAVSRAVSEGSISAWDISRDG
jgi:DNA-binding NarL/FixJ family response regulator